MIELMKNSLQLLSITYNPIIMNTFNYREDAKIDKYSCKTLYGGFRNE